MRFPCEYYIRYLLVGGKARWAIKDIQLHIVELGYPEPSTEYLQGLLKELYDARPKPYLSGGLPDKIWLRQQGLLDIHMDQDDMSEATEHLEDSDVRQGLEALLLSGVNKNNISPIMEGLIGVTISPKVLSLYEHYYWKRDLLRDAEWQSFLELYPNGKGLAVCYAADPRYTLHFLGAEVTDMDMRGMIQSVARDAFFRIQEMRDTDAAKISKAYSDYSTILMSANREMGGATTLSQLLEQVHAIGMKLQKKAVAELQDTGINESMVLDGTVLGGETNKDE